MITEHQFQRSSESDEATKDGKVELMGNATIVYYYPISGLNNYLVADLDNNGNTEIIFGTAGGSLIVASNNGEILWTKTISSGINYLLIGNFYSTEYKTICLICDDKYFRLIGPEGELVDTKLGISALSCYAVGDLDNDNFDEFVTFFNDFPGGLVQAWDGNGDPMWEYDTDKFPGSDESIIIADIDNDEVGEVILGTWVIENKDSLIALESNGELLWSSFLKHQGVTYNVSAGILALEAIDFDNDGNLELAIGSDWCLAVLDNNGNIIWKEDMIIANSLCIGDFNGDGITEAAAVGGAANYNKVHIFNKSGIQSYFVPEKKGKYIYSYDIYGDGTDEMLIGTVTYLDDLETDYQKFDMIAYNSTGTPILALSNTSTQAVFSDLDGDEASELIIGCPGNYSGLYVIKPMQNQVKADLSIESVYLEPSGTSLKDGDKVTINVKVVNVGQERANAVIEMWYDNVSYGTGITPIITPGSSRTFSFDWIAREGNHSIKIKSDTMDVIPEANEDNNVIYIDLAVDPKQTDNGENGNGGNYTNVVDEPVLIGIIVILIIVVLIIILLFAFFIKMQKRNG